jgi:hypothetical protein
MIKKRSGEVSKPAIFTLAISALAMAYFPTFLSSLYSTL